MHSLWSYVLLPCLIVILSQSPREAVFCLVCVVLVLVAVRLDLGTMMAEPCSWFDVLLFCFFFQQYSSGYSSAKPVAAGTGAAGQLLRAPATPTAAASCPQDSGFVHTHTHTLPLSIVQSPPGASQRLSVGCPPPVLVSAAGA